MVLAIAGSIRAIADDKIADGLVKESFDNGAPKSEKTYRNGKLNGVVFRHQRLDFFRYKLSGPNVQTLDVWILRASLALEGRKIVVPDEFLDLDFMAYPLE